MRVDRNANQVNVIKDIDVTIAGEDVLNDRLQVRPTYLGQSLEANATTTLRTGAGVLHKVTINTAGASSNTITLYDNTAASGTVLATIDGTAGPLTLDYNIRFSTGLTAILATGTAAKITVTYSAID